MESVFSIVILLGILTHRCVVCREIYADLDLVGGTGSNDQKRHGSPMVLPLVFSSLNVSRQLGKVDHRARAMQGSGESQIVNAHMKLYDDLLTNGYYTTRLHIGTPPQEFALIVDSGSTVTYVPCSTCEQCGRHQDPRFQPDQSSTYQPVKCTIDCTCDSNNVQCIYERQYAEMSSSSGVLGEDIVSFGQESSLEPQRAVFGCENSETGDLYSQRADGIMGLGRGRLSIMDQLVHKGVVTDSFSLCYGGMDVGGGAMVLGGIPPPPGMVLSPSDPSRSMYYNIELKEIHVAGQPLNLDPSVFNGRHGTILDSGTTYAYLPEVAFSAFKTAIEKSLESLQQIPGPDPSYHDVCFSGADSDASQLSKSFPAVDMVFGNGQKYSLSPENYLFRHSKVHGAYCLGVFQNGKDPTTLLGGIIVRNTLVTYDRANQTVGFWKTNCSELWSRLQPNGSSPPNPAPTPVPVLLGPPPPESSSSSTSPPSSPPSPTTNTSTLHSDVAYMEFVFYFTLNCSVVTPHTQELVDSLADQLGVKSSKVRILNCTNDGSDSLVKWAIFLNSSGGDLSKTKSENILSKLTRHQVELPTTFGDYQLINWEVEHHSERSWWALVVGLLVVFALGSFVFLGWYVWKRRSQAAFGSYKPVDAVIPDGAVAEQELQPLEAHQGK